MSHNFLGAPTREDWQTLEHLRSRIMPMIGLLDKLHVDMQHKLFQGQAVDWPKLSQTITKINGQLTSINHYINGTYKHREEVYRDVNGRPIIDREGNQKMRYDDTAIEGHAEKLESMHVFPQAPFPMLDDRLASMAMVLLDKRLVGPEEKWVEERLRKAAEFAHVPAEWGIEPRKPKEEENEDEEGDDDSKGDVAGIPTRRVKGTLNEDEILEMWSVGHKTAFDRQYQDEKKFGMQATGGGDEDDEDEDEEEMEDVKIEGQTPVEGEGDEDMDDEEDDSEDADSPKAQSSAPVVMIQRAPPSVHKPVPGVPMLSLGIVHRFMASGEVPQPGRL
jgi:hypothetical protein